MVSNNMYMVNNNMYDNLAPLFGLENDDKRIRLFLHLFLATDNNRQIERILFYSDKWDNKDVVSGGTTYPSDDRYVDFEWYIFFSKLGEGILKSNTAMNIQEKIDILSKYENNNKVIWFFTTVPDLFGIMWDGKHFGKARSPAINRDSNDVVSKIVTLIALKLNVDEKYRKSHYDGMMKDYFRVIDDNNLVIKYNARKIFSYKIDKDTAQFMLEDAKNAPTPIGTPSSFLASIDSNITDTYFRDVKDPSKLYTKDNSGNLLEVQRGSKAFWESSKKSCAGLGVKGLKDGPTGQGSTCSDYLLDCIRGADPTQCRKYMTDPEFWGENENSIKNEVRNMLPAMALTTLEKFKFNQITVNDSVAKKMLNKVESVNTWLQRLEKEMTGNRSDFELIQKNTNLTLYLNLLVEKINGSPQILNENIVQSEDTLTYNRNRFKGQLLEMYGLLPKLPFTVNYSASINRLSDTLKYGLNIAASQPQFLVLRAQRGGGNSNMVEDSYKYSSIELETQYTMLKNMLKAHGKQLDFSNDNELQALFASFKNTENKVVQTLNIMRKYIDLMEGFTYNDPHKVLNLETLNEITKAHEHQLNKTAKKQDSLVQALQTLADVVQEAINKSGSANKLNSVVTSLPFTHNN